MARTDPRPHYGRKRRIASNGYAQVWAPDHPMAKADGYVYEHRKVAYDAGMLTDPRAQQVHHRNHDKADNRLANLLVVSPQDHARGHAEERGSVRNQFGEWPIKPRDQRQSAPRPDGRVCAGCGSPVPRSLRRDAAYCSGRCRTNAWKRARRP